MELKVKKVSADIKRNNGGGSREKIFMFEMKMSLDYPLVGTQRLISGSIGFGELLESLKILADESYATLNLKSKTKFLSELSELKIKFLKDNAVQIEADSFTKDYIKSIRGFLNCNEDEQKKLFSIFNKKIFMDFEDEKPGEKIQATLDVETDATAFMQNLIDTLKPKKL